MIQGWDVQFRRFAALKFLPEGLTGSGSGAPLLAAWEQWYGAPHPGLLKPAQLDFAANRLVREWVPGFTLLELLRQRRRLPGAEALALLASAAPALDHAAAHGFPGIALDKWYVAFAQELDEKRAAALLSEPVERWPAWQVRLDPLRLSDLVATGDDRTVHRMGLELPGVSLAVAVAVEGLRDLLGGSRSRRDAPLSGLSDEQNRTLAAARQPGRFASAAGLVKELGGSAPERLCPVWPGRLAGSLETAARGERLFLEPLGPGARPLQLVQRAEFRLGRSSTEADLSLRFTDRSPAGLELTNNLSRVHARLRRAGESLRLLDGSASAASSNGTFTREGPLTDPAGRAITSVFLVQLGSHWRATLAPVPAPHELFPWEEDASGAGMWGAVFTLPSRGCAMRVETVWLLAEAGFGLTAEGSLAWDTEALSSAPAAFRAHKGRFLLLNRRLEAGALSLDSQPLGPGCAGPLREGMELQAGQDRWRVRVT